MSREDQNAYRYYVDEMNIERDARAWERSEGMAEGIEKGRAEGNLEACLKIAKNFKNAGLDISFIAANTGLTEELIRNL